MKKYIIGMALLSQFGYGMENVSNGFDRSENGLLRSVSDHLRGG